MTATGFCCSSIVRTNSWAFLFTRKASAFNAVFPDDPAIPRPWSAFYLLHGLSDEDLRKVMGGNMMELLGVTAKV